jgi:hypothetical protein
VAVIVVYGGHISLSSPVRSLVHASIGTLGQKRKYSCFETPTSRPACSYSFKTLCQRQPGYISGSYFLKSSTNAMLTLTRVVLFNSFPTKYQKAYKEKEKQISAASMSAFLHGWNRIRE